MALKKEHEDLVFPNGKRASEIYADALNTARTKNIPQWNALNQAAKDNEMPIGWESALVALGEQALIDACIAEKGEPELIHSLGVQIAKRFFHNKEGAPVEVSDPIDADQAMQFSLTPLVLISLSVEGTSLHRVQIIPYQNEMNIAPSLAKLWSESLELLGVPNTIKISKHFQELASKLPQLFTDSSPEIVIVDGKDRRHTANINAAHDLHIFSDTKINTLEALNQKLLRPFEIDPSHVISDKKKRIAYKTLQKRSARCFQGTRAAITVAEEALQHPRSIRPEYSRLVRAGTSINKLPFLLAEGREVTGYQSALILDDWFLGILHSLPFSSSKLAELIGCVNTEVQLYLKAKSPLPNHAFTMLCTLLNVSFNGNDEQYLPYPSDFGPLLLTPKTKKHLIMSYDAVTRGGDLDIAYEMVSLNHESGYRYLVVEAYFAFYVFRLEANWPSCEAINTLSLINFSGKICVKDSIFGMIEELCEEVIACPDRYHQLLNDFFKPWSQVTGIDEHTVDYWAFQEEE